MLIEAFKYKQWSDLRTLNAITKINTAQYASSITFALQQLNHMVIVEELFQARLLENPAPHSATNTDVVPVFGELEKRIHASNNWFIAYVSDFVPIDNIRPISFQFTDGRHGSISRHEILFHIINHGTYHRGAIGHTLDLANIPHPADTYTVYIHEMEPERRFQ